MSNDQQRPADQHTQFRMWADRLASENVTLYAMHTTLHEWVDMTYRYDDGEANVACWRFHTKGTVLDHVWYGEEE